MIPLRIHCLSLCLCLSLLAKAQTGGGHAYAFLELVPTARAAAMGGAVNALSGDDVSMACFNPALLHDSMDRTVSLSYVSYLAGIKYGYVSAGWDSPGLGTLAGGVQYVNYGSFTAADEQGVVTGSFSAAEYALYFSYARAVRWNNREFRVGVTLKPVLSHLEHYTSAGLLADFGVYYSPEDSRWAFAAVARHVGTEIKTYAGRHEKMPVDVQAGVAYTPRQFPVRLSLVLQHLEDPRLREEGTRFNEDTGMTETVHVSGWRRTGEELWRHVACGLEFYPFDGFWLRAGYNPLRREELMLDGKKSTVGLSWGAGLQVRKLTFAYASARYHLAGSTNQLSILLHLD